MNPQTMQSKITALVEKRKAAAKNTLDLAKGITKNREDRRTWSKEIKELRDEVRKMAVEAKTKAKAEAKAKREEAAKAKKAAREAAAAKAKAEKKAAASKKPVKKAKQDQSTKSISTLVKV